MAQITGSAAYMAQKYFEYQKKYRTEPRESDKFLLGLIRQKVGDVRGKSLLDIGCHNGNLLYQMKTELPGLRLRGGDLFADVIAQCQAEPDMAGIDFDVMDILDLKGAPADIVVVNAVLFRFDDRQHAQAWKSVAGMIQSGGWVFVFDFYHGFDQTLRIVEETPEHPEGLILTFRPQAAVAETLKGLGFTDITFQPFRIGIDLPLSNPRSALYTHTRPLAGGDRLLFRGTLCQPWCHLAARKA
jgi:hypothetical protein